MYKIVSGTEKIKSNGGLSLVGALLSNFNISSPHPDPPRGRKPITSDKDILLSYLGLLSQGRQSYEDLKLFYDDEYFKESLRLSNIASVETLRQRLDAFSGKYDESIKKYNVELLRGKDFGEIKTSHTKYIPYDLDVSVLDNSGSNKENMQRTYHDGVDGFAPMFSYIGEDGYMLGCELRPGSQHCQKGTPDYIRQDIQKIKELGLHPSDLLARLDSGNDASDNTSIFLEENMNFIIKRNMRRESKEGFLEEVKALGSIEELRPGKTYYCGRIYHKYHGENKIPMVYEITVRTIDKKGQVLLFPEIDVNTYWTNLIIETPEEIIKLYHNHGTSEQFHSELKSDIGVERLPSRKFETNSTILLLANIAFNVLRTIGQAAIEIPKDMPIKKTMKRRRLKSVLRDLIYVGCKYVKTGGYKKLNFGAECPWFTVIKRLYLQFT